MIGGEKAVVERLDPVFRALAPVRATFPRRRTGTVAIRVRGRATCMPAERGRHFVKMIHNGIEYGLMQAYAEGFDILSTGDASLPGERGSTLSRTSPRPGGTAA